MTDSMGIRALAERTGVSAHTLRYYEAAGLMIPVPRDRVGRRTFSEDHLRWVSFLVRLREGGMGISQIKEYAALTQSDSEEDQAQRFALLKAHRDEVRARIGRLTTHLEILERKVAIGCAPDHTSEAGDQP